MAIVKTYHNVNASDKNVSFSIAKMEDIYQKRKGAIDAPHRHQFYTVLLVRRGKGQHKIDFKQYNLGEYQVHFVSPGQVHQVIEEEASEGYVLTFSGQFLVENSIPVTFIDSLNLFHDYGVSPPLQLNAEQFERMGNLVHEVDRLYKSESNMKALSIGAYLKLILIECNNICAIHPIDTYNESSESRIIRAFKKQVNQSYKQQHSTSYYASELNITPDHLNRVVKATIGKTAKGYIQSRLITEAKRLLYFTTNSSKEIGYELGFSEASNFSAFFKKCTGYAPFSFKQRENLA